MDDHVTSSSSIDDISSLRGQAATIPRNASFECDDMTNERQYPLTTTEYLDRRATRRRGRGKLGQWWTSILSRVSRSASSLLNQHASNLNELLQHHDKSAHDNDEQSERTQEVFMLQNEVERLTDRVRLLEGQLKNVGDGCTSSTLPATELCATQELTASHESTSSIPSLPVIQSLTSDQIARYSRQLLLSDGFGVSGQRKLLSSSILVIGAGGIGSSLLLYLAAAGVGHVTIVDFDVVERSNLHRQVIHRDVDAVSDRDSGNDVIQSKNKVQSAKEAMLALNPSISITTLPIILDHTNIMELISKHDVVVDASDNPATRYLLNDACILRNKTLVSGSAMGTEGQLTVYNYNHPNNNSKLDGVSKSACYRCLYPYTNPAEGCKSCSDNGVLGMVPGLIGVLQAVEVIKVVTGIGKVMHDRLLMYDSLPCSFISIKKPPPKSNCAICSAQATIKSITDSQLSLQSVRGPSICVMPSKNSSKLTNKQRISCTDYDQIRKANNPHVLLDVRVTRQYEMCSLDNSINIPLHELQSNLDTVASLSNGTLPVYCLCRRGVASVEATRIIQQALDEGSCSKIHSVYNIDGGLNEWVKSVDDTFPWY